MGIVSSSLYRRRPWRYKTEITYGFSTTTARTRFTSSDWSNATQPINLMNRPTYGRDAGSIAGVAIGRGDDTVKEWKDATRTKQPAWLRMFIYNGHVCL
ncbi:hypothetical protein PILCRDRAFT_814528 [Piloderma croceum F 1598]|uniref:Uncharacterized protein n=1 Tax=Piloderma croceum (strain F 1598) TaxID=765440 RepID=A0A0C3GB05_PILCF|nr:hypothetical protein PILCRDRAFT_814528 [Piloderma croceum F 1598]